MKAHEVLRTAFNHMNSLDRELYIADHIQYSEFFDGMCFVCLAGGYAIREWGAQATEHNKNLDISNPEQISVDQKHILMAIEDFRSGFFIDGFQRLIGEDCDVNNSIITELDIIYKNEVESFEDFNNWEEFDWFAEGYEPIIEYLKERNL